MLAQTKFVLTLAVSSICVGSLLGDATFTTSYGGAGNSFTAHVGGSADFTVSGVGTLRLSPPPILGTAVPIDGTVFFPTRTQKVVIDSTTNSTPTGVGTVRLEDLYSGQASNHSFPPGPDGKADDGNVIDSQMAGTVDSLNIEFVDSPQAVAISNFGLNGVAEASIFGVPVSVPIAIDIDPSVLITSLSYAQIGAASMNGQVAINPSFADGAHPNVEGAQNLSTQYNLVLSSGTFSGDADAVIGAEFRADFGILGSYVQDLGAFSIDAGSISEDFGLVGVGRFLQMATAASGLDFDDLLFQLEGDLDSLIGPLTIPVVITGTLPINESFEVPIDLGMLGTITVDSSFSGSLTYSIDGELTITNLAYALQSQQITQAVNVPEASSLMLLGASGLCGVCLSLRRKRASRSEQ